MSLDGLNYWDRMPAMTAPVTEHMEFMAAAFGDLAAKVDFVTINRDELTALESYFKEMATKARFVRMAVPHFDEDDKVVRLRRPAQPRPVTISPQPPKEAQ